MTREEARKAARVMLAYADGKKLQIGGQDSNEWADVVIPVFNWELNSYRIKLEPTYRPFKDADECWEEMKKHEPFGWIKNPSNYFSVIHIADNGFTLCSGLFQAFSEALKNDLQFIDGTPFGIKED